MSTELFACPKIEVLHWNVWDAYVRCPYCEEIHRHSVKLPGRRASHCDPGGQYEFMFPIDESSKLVGYEIDKRRACFVNISLQKGHEDENLYSSQRDGCELTDLFCSKMNISATERKYEPVLNFYKDSREVKTTTLPDDDDNIE